MARCWRLVGFRPLATRESDRERGHWPASPLLLRWQHRRDRRGNAGLDTGGFKALARPPPAPVRITGCESDTVLPVARHYQPRGQDPSGREPRKPGLPVILHGRAAPGVCSPCRHSLPRTDTAPPRPSGAAPVARSDWFSRLFVRVAPDGFSYVAHFFLTTPASCTG